MQELGACLTESATMLSPLKRRELEPKQPALHHRRTPCICSNLLWKKLN